MSTFGSNSFDNYEESSPFEDPSVLAARRSSGNARHANEYNPYLDDPFSPTPINSESSDLTPLPPPYSPPLPQASLAGAEYLTLQQEELERKAIELERREQALQSTSSPEVRIANFPPLPSGCPLKPCFFQDICLEIPQQYQRIVRINYYYWIALAILIMVNFILAVAYLIVSQVYSVTVSGSPGTTMGIALLYVFLLPTVTFLCDFRAVYNAFRTNMTSFFFVYFINFFIRFVGNVLHSVGFNYSGTVGFLNGLDIISNSVEAGPKMMGVAMLVMGVLFLIMAVINMTLLLRVLYLFRTSGVTIARVQDENAWGIVRNGTWLPNPATVQPVDRSGGAPYRDSGY